ncbi:MAG: hypothetical protein ABI603_11915 [Acidobacteriota bacterium]
MPPATLSGDDERAPLAAEPETLTALRRMILALLVIGLAGLGVELLLLQHFESPAQIIAPGLLATALALVGWHVRDRGPRSLRMLQAAMWLFVGAGGLGLYFHYHANVEFQREMDPSIGGIALIRKALAAKTPPALAPGAMAELGLLGLLYTFRHPGLRRRHGRATPARAS